MLEPCGPAPEGAHTHAPPALPALAARPAGLVRSDACIVAFDPGLRGGIAVLFAETPDRVACFDMPLAGNEVDPHALRRILQTYAPAFAVVERVASRPTDSRPAAFGFGGAYFTVRTALALCHVATHLVAPQVWKKHHRLTGAEDPKEAARALAIQIFPACADQFARKRDHGRADAALLAKFAAVTFG